MDNHRITFDSFIRGLIGIVIITFIIWLLNRLSGVLTPFFLAWLLAYLLFPLVRFFQYRCHLKYRVAGIFCAFLVTALVLWAGFMLIVPPMIDEGLRVKDMLIAYIQSAPAISNLPSQLQEYLHDYLKAERIQDIVMQGSFLEAIRVVAPKAWEVITQSFSVLSSLLSLTMVFLYTFFILIDYEHIATGWQRLIPEKWRGFSVQLVTDVREGMNKYFRGQGCVAFCVGVLFSIGFLIIDFPMAIGLGMLIGLFNMVPYLQIVGLIPTIILAIVKSADTGENFWVILMMALAVFLVVQIIQDTFLTPKIMGKVTGLSSAIILLSLSIWGSLLGVLGMIIALPMTTLILTYYQRYVIQKSKH